VPHSAVPLDEAELQQAFDNLLAKFSQLHRRKLPIATYPPIEGQRPLADLLDDSKRSELICGGNAVTISEFVLNIEMQIWDLFFEQTPREFGGRTLGELFGFTDLNQIWNPAEFEVSVFLSVDGYDPCKCYVFDDFLKDVIAHLEQDLSLPKQDVRKASVNYALAQMRWFSIWMERRVSSAIDCFSRRESRGR
jgi:hypothetical protein